VISLLEGRAAIRRRICTRFPFWHFFFASRCGDGFHRLVSSGTAWEGAEILYHKLDAIPGDRIGRVCPQAVFASEALDQIGRVLKGRGLSLEELIESGPDIRGELVEKEYGPKTEE
jgi:hypothetical protein